MTKVMKIDESAFQLKLSVTIGELLLEHPGQSVLDVGKVKTLDICTHPLASADPLLPGYLYFLVHLPCLPASITVDVTFECGGRDANAHRVYYENLHVFAKDQLEALMFSHCSISDLALHHRPAMEAAVAEASPNGRMRLQLRLPKAEVAMLVEESKDATEAAWTILELATSVRLLPALETHVTEREEVTYSKE